MSEHPPKLPAADSITWKKLDTSINNEPAQSPVKGWRPIEPPNPAQQTNSHIEIKKEASSDRIHIHMHPDELPVVARFYDATTRAPISQRGIKEDWHGAPVIVFPTNIGDSTIIGPCLDADHRDRPEICQDRVAFAYGRDGALKAFAIADGVSQGMASASVADTLVQLTSQHFAETSERMGTSSPSKTDIDAVLAQIQDDLRARINLNAMADDFLATTKMNQRFASAFADDIRKGKSTGSATLIAGIVQTLHDTQTGERLERLTMVQVGDGGYVIIGPYPENESPAHGEFAPAGKAPAQIAPGKLKNIPSDSIHVQSITLRPGEILLASTDGIEKEAWKTLQDFQRRAQELFEHGYTDPNHLVRQLLWESNKGSGSWLDDTTLFAHKAR